MIKAVVLAKGSGSRLGLMTSRNSVNRNSIPKGMAMLCGRPLLWHILSSLKQTEVHDIRIDRGYLGEQIENYFGDGRQKLQNRFNIQYSKDRTMRGTAASLELLAGQKGTTLVHYGDVIIDRRFCLNDLIDFHNEKNSDVTLLVKHVNDVRTCGIVRLSGTDGKILELAEKPYLDYPTQIPGWINCAVYVLSERARERCLSYLQPEEDPDNSKNDFMKNIFPKLLKEGFSFHGFPLNHFWRSVDSQSSLLDLQWKALSGEMNLQIPGRLHKKGNSKIWIEGDPTISRDAELRGFVYISSGASINGQARICNAVIGNNGKIWGRIENSIFPGAFGILSSDDFEVGERALIRRSIVCSGKIHSNLDSQVAAWDGKELVVEDLT
ncbi:MAG: NDP-sugar synthase [Candidatus Saganbacteria bacterium]|nr:NDP-sugar synthase [Candidatus Saganbacteria bacterium]